MDTLFGQRYPVVTEDLKYPEEIWFNHVNRQLSTLAREKCHEKPNPVTITPDQISNSATRRLWRRVLRYDNMQCPVRMGRL